MRLLIVILLMGSAGAGCGNQALYNAGRGWQKNECQKIVENEERARCMEDAAKSSERYKKEQEELKKK